MPVLVSTMIAWFLSLLFAYLTNRKWVFHSEADTAKAVVKEIVSFFACRVGTELIDLFCMWLFVDMLHMNNMVIKVIANVVVIAVNYLSGKQVHHIQTQKMIFLMRGESYGIRTIIVDRNPLL